MGGVTSRRLNQVASARAQELLISHEQAVHAIAHEYGLRLSKYLTAEQMAEIRPLVTQSRSVAQAPAPVAQGKKNGASVARSEIALDKIKIPAGVLSERHRRDAEQMATKVYP